MCLITLLHDYTVHTTCIIIFVAPYIPMAQNFDGGKY